MLFLKLEDIRRTLKHDGGQVVRHIAACGRAPIGEFQIIRADGSLTEHHAPYEIAIHKLAKDETRPMCGLARHIAHGGNGIDIVELSVHLPGDAFDTVWHQLGTLPNAAGIFESPTWALNCEGNVGRWDVADGNPALLSSFRVTDEAA